MKKVLGSMSGFVVGAFGIAVLIFLTACQPRVEPAQAADNNPPMIIYVVVTAQDGQQVLQTPAPSSYETIPPDIAATLNAMPIVTAIPSIQPGDPLGSGRIPSESELQTAFPQEK